MSCRGFRELIDGIGCFFGAITLADVLAEAGRCRRVAGFALHHADRRPDARDARVFA